MISCCLLLCTQVRAFGRSEITEHMRHSECQRSTTAILCRVRDALERSEYRSGRVGGLHWSNGVLQSRCVFDSLGVLHQRGLFLRGKDQHLFTATLGEYADTDSMMMALGVLHDGP